jgi:hypothetical protein
MAQAQVTQLSHNVMNEMEAIWNRPMSAGQPMPSVDALDKAMAEPNMTTPRRKMLQEMRDYSALMASGALTTPKATRSLALKVTELSGEEQELVLRLTRRALHRSGLGRFALAMLEGLLTDHPKVVLKLIQDSQNPTLITMAPLYQKLLHLDEKLDNQFLLVLNRLNEQMIPGKTQRNNPMGAVQAANEARMSANEQIMDQIATRLAGSNPLP